MGVIIESRGNVVGKFFSKKQTKQSIDSATRQDSETMLTDVSSYTMSTHYSGECYCYNTLSRKATISNTVQTINSLQVPQYHNQSTMHVDVATSIYLLTHAFEFAILDDSVTNFSSGYVSKYQILGMGTHQIIHISQHGSFISQDNQYLVVRRAFHACRSSMHGSWYM